jgi:hypothetical protein
MSQSSSQSASQSSSADSTGPVPSGFVLQNDPMGFSIAIPDGWQRIGTTASPPAPDSPAPEIRAGCSST